MPAPCWTGFVNNATGTINYLGIPIVSTTTVKEAYGAFQNSKLTTEEKGAYIHNSTYAKRLIFDAIDWLDNGSLNGTITIPAGYPDARLWFERQCTTGVASRP